MEDIITKEKFETYENVRKSGVTNMFDVKTVEIISGLDREEILNIMENYSEYIVKYGGSK